MVTFLLSDSVLDSRAGRLQLGTDTLLSKLAIQVREDAQTLDRLLTPFVKVEREHVDYSSIKDHIKSMQAVFQEVNGSLLPDSMQLPSPPDTIFQAEMLGSMNDRPLRVLSLGGFMCV